MTGLVYREMCRSREKIGKERKTRVTEAARKKGR